MPCSACTSPSARSPSGVAAPPPDPAWRGIGSGKPGRVWHSGRARALVGFAGFGAFWGAWGAALPAVQSHAGASDAALGLALVCIGAGALASMRLAGAAVDRFGPRVLPVTFAAFAGCAVLPALVSSPGALAAVLLALGAASGAADVAINAEGTHAETEGRPVMNLGHAAFSASVVGASLGVGVLRGAGAGAPVVLGAVAVLLLAIAAVLARIRVRWAPVHERKVALLRIPAPLAILGALAALAYLVENAWQSWSAVQLESTLDAAPAVAALGPALFGASAAIGRLAGHALTAPASNGDEGAEHASAARVSDGDDRAEGRPADRADEAGPRVSDRQLLAGGATLGGLGTLLGALAPSAPLALVGIAVAGLGTSVCAPTLIGLAGRIFPRQRGSAVAGVTTLAYLGFLIGPAAVGLAAGAASLPAALAGVAAVAGVLAVGSRFAPVARRA
jgi:MFS family permease